MRGDGHIFQKKGSKNWYIVYYFNGKRYEESCGAPDKRVAGRLLRQRLKEARKPNFVSPAKEKGYTLDDMLEIVRQESERKQNRAFKNVKYCFRHLQEGFKFHRVIDITSEKIPPYGEQRFKEGASRATVNRELTALGHGFRLMIEKRMVSTMPVIKLYREDNTRKGFIDIGDLNAVLEKIPNPNVRDLVEFLYHSGWRQIEGLMFQWSWIDQNMIRIPAEYSKTKEPRRLPIVGRLMDILERRQKVRRLDCPYVFHRNGKPIKYFRKAFYVAAAQIEHPSLRPHDMRRSAVRNFRRAGLSESEGMMLSGHKTRSVYERYNILDDRDAIEAMQKVQQHLAKESKQRRVIPIKREAT
jgi:integrase